MRIHNGSVDKFIIPREGKSKSILFPSKASGVSGLRP